MNVLQYEVDVKTKAKCHSRSTVRTEQEGGDEDIKGDVGGAALGVIAEVKDAGEEGEDHGDLTAGSWGV